MYPDVEFIVTGVLGFDSNEHGPNEALDIEYTQRLTACVAMILREFA